jgi:hypothetical protein
MTCIGRMENCLKCNGDELFKNMVAQLSMDKAMLKNMLSKNNQ